MSWFKQCNIFLQNFSRHQIGVFAMSALDDKVYVIEHPRFRYGRWEHVCSHTRSLPKL
jgi:hypothetical protein